MIVIITSHSQIRQTLTREFDERSVAYRVFDSGSELAISGLYASGIRAAIVDAKIAALDQRAWLDMVGSLGRRLPVFVLGHFTGDDKSIHAKTSDLIGWHDAGDPAGLLALLESFGFMTTAGEKKSSFGIPVYNPQVPLHLLQGHGALSMLTINSSGFRKIAIEYGMETYQKLQDQFHKILEDMWISAKKIRKTDMIMRRSPQSNTYYVFLEQSRISKAVPSPGVLEKVADRVALSLQQALWEEIFKPRGERVIPDCINLLPEFSVGHATALNNPCVEVSEILEHLIEASADASKVQMRRIKDRELELMQSIVQGKDILTPHFQAVFDLGALTKEKVESARAANSISGMVPALYGFESLIRARKSEILRTRIEGDHLVALDSRHMRPDILFGMAAHCKVSLELDQVCLALGTREGSRLPGKLMVNILPRNLAHLERLSHLISARGSLVFEISESERIANPEAMQRVRRYIQAIGCSIAADDFGKGHGSIERVIQLRPEIIKLDRSLVDNIHQDPGKRIFAEGIVKAARLVNAKVLAEGVEKWEEAQVFKEMGVDLIQGYLLHRPQSLEEIQKQISKPGDSETKLDSVA